jgi:hypothetical protein
MLSSSAGRAGPMKGMRLCRGEVTRLREGSSPSWSAGQPYAQHQIWNGTNILKSCNWNLFELANSLLTSGTGSTCFLTVLSGAKKDCPASRPSNCDLEASGIRERTTRAMHSLSEGNRDDPRVYFADQFPGRSSDVDMCTMAGVAVVAPLGRAETL